MELIDVKTGVLAEVIIDDVLMLTHDPRVMINVDVGQVILFLGEFDNKQAKIFYKSEIGYVYKSNLNFLETISETR